MKVCEIFGITKQGEGPFSGENCIFIRFSGCVKPLCKWCDTKYSWKDGATISPKQILAKIKHYNCKRVVITGGEPYIQKSIYKLISMLIESNYSVQMETSGKVPIKRSRAHVVCCPKYYGREWVFNVNPKYIDTFKFVARDKRDFKLINDFISKHKINKKDVYIMPLTTTNNKMNTKIKQRVWDECIKSNLKFNIRVHVEVWGIKKRGV